MCRIKDGRGIYCSKECFNHRSSKMINCKVCGKEIKLFLSRTNSNYAYYCSKECWNKENKKGKKINCLHCNKKIYVQPCKFKTKKYCSKKCLDLHRSIFQKGKLSGEKNPSWRGGITPIKKKIRNSSEWKEWRTKIFERDNYTCQKCYSDNCLLHPHHLNPFKFSRIINYLKDKFGIDKLYNTAMNYKLLWDPNIGITLCVPCHKKTKGYSSKL